mmetsp:Transcript_60086/g.193423  ORF Transcript_60086/g.193423 Transcript_60086/m.193423 type:complete len:470 (-) Transcript_60086:474-1883(-)
MMAPLEQQLRSKAPSSASTQPLAARPAAKAKEARRAGPRGSSAARVRMSTKMSHCREAGTHCARTLRTAAATSRLVPSSRRVSASSRLNSLTPKAPGATGASAAAAAAGPGAGAAGAAGAAAFWVASKTGRLCSGRLLRAAPGPSFTAGSPALERAAPRFPGEGSAAAPQAPPVRPRPEDDCWPCFVFAAELGPSASLVLFANLAATGASAAAALGVLAALVSTSCCLGQAPADFRLPLLPLPFAPLAERGSVLPPVGAVYLRPGPWLASGRLFSASLFTSCRRMGPLGSAVGRIAAGQPAFRKSRTSRSRKRMRGGTELSRVSASTLAKTAWSRCALGHSGLSKLGPATLSSAVRHSSASGQEPRAARSASAHSTRSLELSMPRTRRWPTSFTLPSTRRLRLAAISSRSSTATSRGCGGASKSVSKAPWHSPRSNRRKEPGSAEELTADCSRASASRRTQRSAYMGRK